MYNYNITPMNQSKKIILLVALVLTFFIYALVNHLSLRENKVVLSQNFTTNPNSKYEIPISWPPPISIEDALTSDINKWSTYRNEQFGFSVKYPPGWGVTNEEFPGDVWFIGFWQSPHDSIFGFSIGRDSLAIKTAKETKDGSPPHVYTNRGYSFGFRSDEEFLNLVLPTLRFF